jgi:hypothetical protein
MNKDIIIGGVSLEVLKAQQTEIRKDASKVIAEHLAAGTALVEQLVKEPEDGEAVDYEALAEQALEHMEVVELVAGVSGVTFFLPYYEEDGQYESSDILSSQIEEAEHLDSDWQSKNAIYRLNCLLNSMEGDSCNWHSSMC